MILPKIVYDPGTGAVTLNFTYPPVQKPGIDPLSAIRHDSTTISGIRQAITERVDTLRTVQIDFVPFADLTAWGAFMNFALQGGTFKYYPDATLTAFDTWELEDTDWKLSLNVRLHSKFTLQLRKVIGGAAGS